MLLFYSQIGLLRRFWSHPSKEEKWKGFGGGSRIESGLSHSRRLLHAFPWFRSVLFGGVGAFMRNLIFVYGRFCRCRYILQCYVQSRPSSNLQVASASCAIRFVYWSLGEFLIKKGREQKKKSKWVSRWVGLGFGDLWFNLCLLFQLPFQPVLARLTWAAPSVSARRCLCQLFRCFSALPREQTG